LVGEKVGDVEQPRHEPCMHTGAPRHHTNMRRKVSCVREGTWEWKGAMCKRVGGGGCTPT
jgi:hypothetical protein